MIRFTTPFALLLLLILPLVAYLGWPSRGYGRRREATSLLLRLIIVACLVLALGGLEIRSIGRSNPLSVVFLVDVSDSMTAAAKSTAMDYLRQSLEKMGPDDQAAVVVFGKEALVERPMSKSREIGPLTSAPDSSQTDLAEAIALGMALYPSQSARRMVILSDGAATTGNAAEAARLAAASGIDVVVLPLVKTPGEEVLVSNVETPSRLRQGDQFDLNLTLEATQPTTATVRVLAAGQVAYEGQYTLRRGLQTFSLPLEAQQPGFIPYQVQAFPAADAYYQNNELAAYSQVSGPPQVLVVAPPEGERMGYSDQTRPDEAAALRSVLESAGYIVQNSLPYQMPAELPTLAEYSSVVLVDVPARELTNSQMLALQAYVRDLGGGLVVIGGPTSYGVGGYFRTPLEETLPLEMQIKDEQRRATLAIVFIIDHSGSMSETSGGVSKIELAKEATLRSVDLLTPSDRVGVVAFDESASWVVPMTDLSDPGKVKAAIATLRSGGGTDILAGVKAMAQVLPNEPATNKHVILLTDGGADPTGIPELVRDLYENAGITLTTIGVGRDAAPFLPQLAELGGGRYHFAANPGSIPSIYTEETTLATRAYIVEETFTPRLQAPSPILDGIQALPPLHGYVGTSAKPGAQVALVSSQDDPILAAWQYGLGKAVAFTSDATGRWASDWVSWKDFGTFWSQAVRYTSGEPIAGGLDIQVQEEGDRAHLVVEAINRSITIESSDVPAYLNGYNFEARILSPDGVTQSVDLMQTAPGRYEANFPPSGQGVYLIHVSGQSPEEGGGNLSETAGWVQSYSPEYRQLDSDPDALIRLAAAAGGSLAPTEPGKVFAHNLAARGAARPAWTWLLTLAACLLPIDIALRRLVVTRADLRRGWENILQTLLSGKPSPVPVQRRAKQMESLLRVKQAAGEGASRSTVESGQVPYPEEARTGTYLSPELTKQETKITSDRPVPASPSQSITAEVPQPPPEGQTSSIQALIARKRQQKKSPEDKS